MKLEWAPVKTTQWHLKRVIRVEIRRVETPRYRAIWKNWLFEPPVIRCLKSWEWWAFVNSLCTLVNCSRYLLGINASSIFQYCLEIQWVCVCCGRNYLWCLRVIWNELLCIFVCGEEGFMARVWEYYVENLNGEFRL